MYVVSLSTLSKRLARLVVHHARSAELDILGPRYISFFSLFLCLFAADAAAKTCTKVLLIGQRRKVAIWDLTISCVH
jgi:DNA-binding transcriptional regulator/RsmH inhibitor MraZ